MDSGSRQLVGEVTVGAAGIVGALHAAAQAGRRRAAEIRWQQRQDRIEARWDAVAAKHQRIQAMQRELSALRTLNGLLRSR